MRQFDRLRFESIALCLAPYCDHGQLRELQACAEVKRFKPNLLHFFLEVLIEDHITEKVESGSILSQGEMHELTSGCLIPVVDALTDALLDGKSKPWAKLLKDTNLPVPLRQMLSSLDAIIEAVQDEDGLRIVGNPTPGTEIYQHIRTLEEFFCEKFSRTYCCMLLIAGRLYLSDCIDTMVRTDCSRPQYSFPSDCLKTNTKWSVNRSIKAAILRMRDGMYGFKGSPNYTVDYVSFIVNEVCRTLNMTGPAHFKYSRTSDSLLLRVASDGSAIQKVRIGGFWSFKYIFVELLRDGHEHGNMVHANLCHVDDVDELVISIVSTIQEAVGDLALA